jgi:hypothetical protein
MMPPGHIAATWGVAHLMQQTNPRLARLDYRWLAVSAMAADIIDKPLALFVFTDTHTSQLLAHSLSLSLLLLTLSLLFWRSGLPYALAFAGHLIADRMWNHPESFWWPFFGWQTFWQFKPMNTPAVMLNVYLDIITRYPQVWVIEIIALFYLLWFAVRFRLYRWAELKHFVLTGRTVRPEEGEVRVDGAYPPLPQKPVGSASKLR